MLLGNKIDCKTAKQNAENIVKAIDCEDKRKFEPRTRILLEMTKIGGLYGEDVLDEPIKRLSLNEVFIAEHDVASASRYRIKPNGVNLGLFKSSGLIVSTGVGSTGWLYAAR